MNRLPHITLILATVLLVAAEKKDEEPASSPAQIQQWINLLGDEKFKVREEATRDLIKAGVVAFDAVTKATKSEDAEVKQRALGIIKQINKQLETNFLIQGKKWFKSGKLDKAIANYDEAIRLNPKGCIAYVLRGLSWEWKRNKEKADSNFDKAHELSPRLYLITLCKERLEIVNGFASILEKEIDGLNRVLEKNLPAKKLKELERHKVYREQQLKDYKSSSDAIKKYIQWLEEKKDEPQSEPRGIFSHKLRPDPFSSFPR